MSLLVCGHFSAKNQSSPRQGYFHTTNFPNQYPAKDFCIWRFVAPDGHFIRVVFLTFETEYSYDKVTIYDGNTTSSDVLATLSGLRHGDLVESTGEHLMVLFKSDSVKHLKGFNASYHFILDKREYQVRA